MMKMPEEKMTPAQEANDYYFNVVGQMTRAERRTAKGRAIVAEAKVKALELEIALMKQEMQERQS